MQRFRLVNQAPADDDAERLTTVGYWTPEDLALGDSGAYDEDSDRRFGFCGVLEPSEGATGLGALIGLVAVVRADMRQRGQKLLDQLFQFTSKFVG